MNTKLHKKYILFLVILLCLSSCSTEVKGDNKNTQKEDSNKDSKSTHEKVSSEKNTESKESNKNDSKENTTVDEKDTAGYESGELKNVDYSEVKAKLNKKDNTFKLDLKISYVDEIEFNDMNQQVYINLSVLAANSENTGTDSSIDVNKLKSDIYSIDLEEGKIPTEYSFSVDEESKLLNDKEKKMLLDKEAKVLKVDLYSPSGEILAISNIFLD